MADDHWIPEEMDLMNAIAKGEGLYTVPRFTPHHSTVHYTPLYKHPLPVSSEARYDHEHNLTRILSAKVPLQGMAAIAKCDAWALEEVYMRHGRGTEHNAHVNFHFILG